MNQTEILAQLQQLADNLRNLPPAEMLAGTAIQSLASVPGKGSPLTQWFNRESNPQKKRLISDILGLIARANYQQKPEFYQTTADELQKLCERITEME